MLLNDLVKIVEKMGAPVLASLLGSPLASIGLALLSSHFNVAKEGNNGNWIANIANAICNQPEALTKLENQHQEAILTILANLTSKSVGSAPAWVAGTLAIILAFTVMFVGVAIILHVGQS